MPSIRSSSWGGPPLYAGRVGEFTVRQARTRDVRRIQALLEPFVQRRILLGKDLVVLYEATQQFLVAEVADGWLHHGVGRSIVEGLEANARTLGISRLFCLTFEVDFFTRRGFAPIGEQVVDPDVYSQLIRSPDEGVAEFLDLAHVKPNTLGNTRMLKRL